MLVAISGTQGSGKTTLLNELETMGHNIIQRKTARSILSDWGTTLEEVYNSKDDIMKFQIEIARRKHSDELFATHDKAIWFTERSYADLMVYTTINLGGFNQYSDWLNDYYNMLLSHNKSYDFVFQLDGGKFDIADDGVRSINKHYGLLTEAALPAFNRAMSKSFYHVEASSLSLRCYDILSIISSF